MLLLHPTVAPWLQRGPEGCEVSLLTERDDLAQVWLRSTPDNEEHLLAMRPVGRNGSLHRWQAFLPWDTGNALTLYAFKVVADGTQAWLAADGPHGQVPPEHLHFRLQRQDLPPAWVRDQIFYQIFPDRFARGGPAADRRGEMLPGQPPQPVLQPSWDEPIDFANAANSFYGGDLPGITQKLDYLQNELGVTALYLNPVFTAGSNHKYDTEDYDQVDPHLGGNEALQTLSGTLHGRGMRLVLDAVVNHTGTNHRWFNRWGTHGTLGAAQSADSPFRSFYVFSDQGVPHGWKGYDTLPVLDFASPALRAAIYDGPDAVLRHWLRPPYRIDGWRLDVIHMLGEGTGARNNAHFVREFRRAIKQENSEAYVLGEHFSEATRWLQGDQEDGAMNYYGFGHPVRAWLAGLDMAAHPVRLDTPQFERWLAQARATIPYDNQLAQLNLLDSHDTARLLTLLGGDVQRMRLAATLLFTSPGVPCIYYGDEVGMEGGQDPDCRRPFTWERERWNLPLFEHYRALAALRQQRGEWRHGACQTLAVGDDWLVFARCTDWEASVIAVNRGPAARVRLPIWQLPLHVRAWRELSGQAFSVADGHMSLELPACGSAVLMSE